MVSKVLTSPTAAASPDKSRRLQTQSRNQQELALAWTVWELEGTGSCRSKLESFWLPAHPQTHFCFKGATFGNRLAAGGCEIRVPCSTLEMAQAHRDHCQGQGPGCFWGPGGWPVGWCLSCPHFWAGMKGMPVFSQLHVPWASPLRC